MAIQPVCSKDSHVLEVYVSDKLSGSDYQRFVPACEELIEDNRQDRILCDVSQFDGWEAQAPWEDLRFAMKIFHDVDRVALVGRSRWQEWMAVFCRAFPAATIRCFEDTQSDEARAWIHSL
jgi:Protein of unknown function (DUF3478).